MTIIAANTQNQKPTTAASTFDRRLDIQPRARVRRPIELAPTAEAAPPISVAPMPSEPQPPPSREYEVGYGKPPKDNQFKKGKSGNPKGRPKGAKNLKTIIRSVMEEKVFVKTRGRPKKMARVEALVRTTSDRAFAGDQRSTQTLFQHYAASVPDDTSHAQSTPTSIADQDAHDTAILAALRQSLWDEEDDE